jgi:uncharacterized Zn finger protein
MEERKRYSGVIGRQDGIGCDECACKMSFVIKTEHIGDCIKRIRRCRNCGHTFHSVESRSEKNRV